MESPYITGSTGKKIQNPYDLVSGKVNMVSYEDGKGDQFYYKYQYDADNRVTRSYSSRDKMVWIEDASYNYYLHGPLARTELGQYKVQGVDYAYTLQGWLKGINSNALSPQYEIGRDGWSGTGFARVSRDVYSYGLGYFEGDYSPVHNDADAMNQAVYQHPDNTANTGRELFNGNISNTNVALSKIDNGAAKGYSYGYDQLNRLVFMNQHTVSGSTWSNTNIISAYAESIAYDANGNILKYLRKGANVSGMPLNMDSLTYKYNRDGDDDLVNNRLNHVRDQVSNSNYAVDIDNQNNNNYSYDRIGNLIKDVAEGIDTIHWTVYGKIKKIVKANGTVITYSYDPGGNRTSKQVTLVDTTTITFYARDAQGNVMAVYTQKDETALRWTEQHLYGSSRLGMFQWDTFIPTSPPVVDDDPIYDSLMLGSRIYELSNHLGNVLSTISDKKIGHDNSGVVDYYIAEVLSQNDYYPFGMIQPGRKYSATDSYRYGFNGKEYDNEISGQGNQLDYGFRIYNPRLGRFLSVDPLFKSYPWYTPYQFAGNKPIAFIDLDGTEDAWYKLTEHKTQAGLQYCMELVTKSKRRSLFGFEDLFYIDVSVLVGKGPSDNITATGLQELNTITTILECGNGESNVAFAKKLIEQQNSESWNAILSMAALDIAGRINTPKTPYSPNIPVVPQKIAEEERSSITAIVNKQATTANQVNANAATVNTTSIVNESITAKITTPQQGFSALGKEFRGTGYKLMDGRFQTAGGKGLSGTFDFVVTNDGKLKLGHGHYYLSEGAAEVKAAGQIQIVNGKITNINNASGHYQPTVEEAKKFGEVLKGTGVDVSGANLNLYEAGKKIEKIKL